MNDSISEQGFHSKSPNYTQNDAKTTFFTYFPGQIDSSRYTRVVQ